MSDTSKVQIANLDIPLHRFRLGLETTHKEIDFEHLRFRDAPALSQASWPHRHDFYEILYVTGGEGTHYIDFNAYPIEPNTIFFISPGQVHYWETTVPIEGHILVFTEDFLLLAPADYMVLNEFSFFHSVEESPTLGLDDLESLKASLLYQTITKEFAEYRFRAASVLRAYLHILLVELQRIYATKQRLTENEQGKLDQKLTRGFKQLISRQLFDGLSVEDVAGQLGVSTNHLNNTVKRVTGYTPGQLIRQELAIEAKRLFQHTDLTAAEVGYRLGFADRSYFGRFFKREVGISPGQFRQSLKSSS